MPTRATVIALFGCLAAAPACGPAESSLGSVFSAEQGLTAAYFDGRDLERPSGVYRDAHIDFDGWDLNELIWSRGHRARTVSIRWTGQIWFEDDEPYTVSFELRGRVRLWIDDALIIDDWVDSGTLREARGTVAAAGAGWRDLRIEWDQVAGPMTARLRAQSPARARAIVPASELRHLDAASSASLERVDELPLSFVTGVAASPDGLVVGGVSAAEDRFWDAWVIPVDGGTPRRLAPIGTNLISVDASGALWSTIVGEDEAGNPSYELRLSPSDGSPSVPLSRSPVRDVDDRVAEPLIGFVGVLARVAADIVIALVEQDLDVARVRVDDDRLGRRGGRHAGDVLDRDREIGRRARPLEQAERARRVGPRARDQQHRGVKR